MSSQVTTDKCENMLSFWEDRRRLNRAVFDWCLRNVEGRMSEGNIEKSLQWARLAAFMACTYPFDRLASPDLENHLLKIASKLPVPRHNVTHRNCAPKRWLHVLTMTGAAGGHNMNLRRWIELEANARRHTVALLDHKNEVPSSLSKLVCGTGGEVLKMDTNAPLLTRAMQLREACMEADVVVLHVHPWDVIPVVALGVCGGPPVLFVNHADHMFWVGGSVADVVLNMRDSFGDWIVRHRGIRRINFLPILVPTPDSVRKAGEHYSDVLTSTRKMLELPLDATVILTSGLGVKYYPVPGLNFFDAARAILMSCPEAYLVAVGQREVGNWKALRQVTKGRVRAVGQLTDVSLYYEIADIYLEGFPFGSNTAFLEAGIKAIPCVPAPRVCSLLGSDGVAPSQLERPADVSAYVRRAIELIADKDERRRCGESLATAIRERHTAPSWIRYLRNIEAQLPSSHSVNPITVPNPIPRRFADLLAQFNNEWDNQDPLSTAYRSAISLGLKPKLDAHLRKVVRSAKHVRGSGAVNEVVVALSGPMLSMFPTKTSSQIYDEVITRLSYDAKIMRMCRWVINRFSHRP
jgi:hypothetical protein